MADPPPPPPLDPPSTDLLPHPTSIPPSNTQFPSSDLVRIGPDLAASVTVPATSVHLLHPQPSHPPSTSRSSSKRPSSVRARSRSETPNQFPSPSAASGPALGSGVVSAASRSEIPHLSSSSLTSPPPVLALAHLQAATQTAASSVRAFSQPAQSALIPAPSSVLAAVSAATGSAAAQSASAPASSSVLAVVSAATGSAAGPISIPSSAGSSLQAQRTATAQPSPAAAVLVPPVVHALPVHLQAVAQFPPRDSAQLPLPPSATANLQAAAQSAAPHPASVSAAVSVTPGYAAGPSSCQHVTPIPPLSSSSAPPPVQQAGFPLHPPYSVVNPHQQVLPHQLSAAASQPSSSSAIPRRSESTPSLAAASHSGPILTSTPTSSAPQQQTYAQVARNSRGPGFVRSHASEVESFARLPRTGVNIICGTREGMPSFSFVNSELPKIEELYTNALVMKFRGGRPSLEASHKEIQSWGIDHPFSIGPLSSRAYLLRFQNNGDLLKVLARPSTLLISFPYKVYRWHNLCHMKEDSCLAPVWISLPRLPLQCFIPEFLESVANRIGRFLCFDKATSTLARPSAARICVEIDLRKAPPPFIWVGLYEGFQQQIIYERLPKYCNLCHVIGHVAEGCTKAKPFMPSSHVEQRVHASRPSAVHQHTPAHSPSNQQVNSTVSAPPPPPQSTLPPPTSAAPSPSVAHFQGQPTGSFQQRIPATTTPSGAHPQALMTAAPLQQALIAAGTSDALFSAQQTAALLQSEPAAAAPSSTSSLPQQAPSSWPPPPGDTVPPDKNISSEQCPVSPSVHHPTNPLKTTRSSTLKKSNNQQCNTVALMPQQTNLEANQVFWNAVNNQLALNEQERLRASIVAASNSPVAICFPGDPSPPITTIQGSYHSDDDCSSQSSIAADSQPNSPSTTIQDAQYPYDSFKQTSYDSEGEEPITEHPSFQGYNTDDLLPKRSKHSKRNKRHPDQPLKVQLRARKTPNPKPSR